MLCLCLFKPHLISENVLFSVILSLLLTQFHIKCSANTQLQSQQTCDYSRSSHKRMIFYQNLSSTTVCIMDERIQFCIWRQQKVCTLSSHCNLKNAHFESSSHASSLNKPFWTSTKTHSHLLLFGKACICTLRLEQSSVALSITKYGCGVEAHCR